MEKLTDDPVETEIKILIANLERIHSKLIELDIELGCLLLDSTEAEKYEAEYVADKEYNTKMVDVI